MNGAKATIAGAMLGIVSATVNLVVAFGIRLNDAQKTAIIAEATAATVVAPLIGALIDHSHRQAASRVDAANVAASTLTEGVHFTTAAGS
jgi:integral membrane sensor domain MASE1